MKLHKGIVFGLTVMLVVSTIGVTIGGLFEQELVANELMGDVIEIYTWADLHNMRNNLTANYTLMNNLGPGDVGYDDYASENADGGAGWLPVGDVDNRFTGRFDGQNYTLTGVYIYRPSMSNIGLFGYIDGGEVNNIGQVDANVSGRDYVGGLVGRTFYGTVFNSYATGTVSGVAYVGGLVGHISDGTVLNSYATGNVSGVQYWIGGLVGWNHQGTVSNSYATGDVTGDWDVGGLVGYNEGPIDNSYATGNVSGYDYVGGLVGRNYGTVSDSYATGSVSGTDRYVGGLVGNNDANAMVSNSYATGNVSGSSRVGGLVGENSGGTSTVSNSYATGSVSGNERVGGLVGENWAGTVENSYATGTVSGYYFVGGLVGENWAGTVENSYATGNVSGDEDVGGLVGWNSGGAVINSFYDRDTTGQSDTGKGEPRTTAEMREPLTFMDAGWDIDIHETEDPTDGYPFLSIQVEGNSPVWYIHGTPPTAEITDWHELHAMRYNLTWEYKLMNDLTPETPGYHDYNDPVTPGWLPIGTDTDPFTGSFDGRGHTITGLYINRSDTNYVGLFGYVDPGGEIINVGLVDMNVSGDSNVGGAAGWNRGVVTQSYSTGLITGAGNSIGGLVGRNDEGTITLSYSTGDVTGTDWWVGGLVGYNDGTVSNSYATGSTTATSNMVGGLVGRNDGMVSNSYATGNVSGTLSYVGGLVGYNIGGSATVSNSYATGDVSGNDRVGGLVGENHEGTVSNSYARGRVVRITGSTATWFGGFAGRNYRGQIINCYSTGRVIYEDDTDPMDKGFCGEVDTGGEYEMTSNFWDTETSMQSSTECDATGKTTEEMKNVSTFTNLSTEGLDAPWDFVGDPYDDEGEEDIWAIDGHGIFNDGYPFLSWQRVIYALTVNVEGLGTVYVDGDEVIEWPYQELYDDGTELQLEAEPKPGFEFVGWVGDVESEEPEINITISDHMTLTAVFELEYEPEVVDIYPGQDESVSGYGMVFSARLDHPGEIDIEYASVTLLDTGLEFRATILGNVSVMNMPFVMDEGRHTYEIYMVDAYGFEHYAEVSFYVDNTAPLLEITSPADGVEELTYDEDFTIEGSTEPGVSLWINDVSVEVDGDGNFSYETSLVEGLNVFKVVAEDQAGNTAQTTVYALYLPQIPEILEAIEALEAGIQENRDNITALQEELEALDIDLGHLTDRVDALESALAENITALENAIAENRDDITDIQDNITAIWDELQSLVNDIDNIWSHIGEIDHTIVNILGYIEYLNQTTEGLWIRIGEVEFNMTGKIDALQTALEENVTALEALINENADDIGAVQDDISDIYDNIMDIWDELQELDDELINIWSSINDLFHALESTLTEDEIHALLQDYLKTGDLEAVLEDYMTQDEIDTLLDSYITEARMEELLGEYLTDDEISEILDNYVSSATLEELLGDYLSDVEIDELLGNMRADIMSELQDTMDNYVLHSDLERELEEQEDDSVSPLTMIGLIAAVLAIVIALFAVFKKGGADGEPLDAEDESVDDGVPEEEDVLGEE